MLLRESFVNVDTFASARQISIQPVASRPQPFKSSSSNTTFWQRTHANICATLLSILLFAIFNTFKFFKLFNAHAILKVFDALKLLSLKSSSSSWVLREIIPITRSIMSSVNLLLLKDNLFNAEMFSKLFANFAVTYVWKSLLFKYNSSIW